MSKNTAKRYTFCCIFSNKFLIGGLIMLHFSIQKRDILLLFLSAIIFILGLLTGIMIFSNLSYNPSDNSALNSLALEPKFGFKGAIDYFTTNITACFLLILGIFTFGIPTIFGLFLNGLILGVVIDTKYLEGISAFKIFAGIMTHGILELPALIIAGYLGLKGLDFYFKKDKEWGKNLKLFILVTVLLFGAGLIEALITPIFIN